MCFILTFKNIKSGNLYSCFHAFELNNKKISRVTEINFSHLAKLRCGTFILIIIDKTNINFYSSDYLKNNKIQIIHKINATK